MATVNQFKFFGVNLATTAETAMFGTNAAGTQLPTINQTYIIKSFRVTNNTGNTPTISFDVLDSSNSVEATILNTQSLTANSSVEILTMPLVLESSDILKATVSSNDNVNIGISYLNIT